jgi:hypothetical protein
MTVYIAERNLAGIGMDDLAGAQRSAIDTATRMSDNGTPVRYIRSTFLPAEGKCMCLFEAESADVVEKLNQDAQLPYERVIEALDLTP